jgi:hypothetical protein
VKSKRLWLAIALNALAFFMVIFRSEASITIKIWYSVMGYNIFWCGFESKFPHGFLKAGAAMLPFVRGETLTIDEDDSET